MESKSKAEAEQIFDFLFSAYYKPLCIYAYGFVHDTETGKELVQDVYIQLWEKVLPDHHSGSLKSFLYVSVRNAAIDYLRHSRTQSVYEQKIRTSSNEEYFIFDDIVINELEEKIETVIQQLPPQCQKIFRMNRQENKKYKEISEELHISIKAVEAQVSKALLFFKSEFKKHWDLYFFLFFIILT